MAKKKKINKKTTKKKSQDPKGNPEAKNKGGRPRKEVDWVEFNKLCAMQATEQEIADWFEMDTNTLEARIREKFDGARFSEIFRQKRGKGKIALRRKQMQVAESGNVTMLIWLGKQYLDQSDKSVSFNEHAIGGPVFVDEDDATDQDQD